MLVHRRCFRLEVGSLTLEFECTAYRDNSKGRHECSDLVAVQMTRVWMSLDCIRIVWSRLRLLGLVERMDEDRRMRRVREVLV